jgi:hypothetical protein
VKLPVPFPSEVCASEIPGLEEALQHIPREVTELEPSEETLPPPSAVAWVMLLMAFVPTDGASSAFFLHVVIVARIIPASSSLSKVVKQVVCGIALSFWRGSMVFRFV